MNKKKILANYVESNYINLFASSINDEWICGKIAFTDINNKKMKYEKFILAVEKEIIFSFRLENLKENLKENFDFFLLNEENLIPLTQNNYEESIDSPGLRLFLTQNKEKSLNLYQDLLRSGKIQFL